MPFSDASRFWVVTDTLCGRPVLQPPQRDGFMRAQRRDEVRDLTRVPHHLHPLSAAGRHSAGGSVADEPPVFA